MVSTRVRSGNLSSQASQTPGQIAAAVEEFLLEHASSIVLEDGKILFDMQRAKYSVATDYGRCTLQLWDEERNIVRQVSATAQRGGGYASMLRLTTRRFGQSRPGSLEIVANKDRRPPSTREANRIKYLRMLERVLLRRWGGWKPEGFCTAMDLERSFGPAYARGSLVRGQQAWAVIGVNSEESQATVDGILTLGILWLTCCKENGGGARLYAGLRVIVPKGMATLTASRLAWMNPEAGQWELWELDEKTEDLEQRDPADHGNLATRIVHLPNDTAARERFGGAIAKVISLVPEPTREVVEIRVRTNVEIAFLLHGLEFARVRAGYAGLGFNRVDEITFGAGPNETTLTERNEAELREMVGRLCARRTGQRDDAQRAGVGANRLRPGDSRIDSRDPLYRMQPERWLESVLRRDIAALDGDLDPVHVYTQVPAFAASDRAMLDLLGVDRRGRLAVIEVKADDDLQLALQGLDYWVRVRWYHMQTADSAAGSAFGLGEFQRHGYFAGTRLSDAPPKLYLVAPALRIHSATETVLRYFSPRVEWELIALDERWREEVRVIWRKRSSTYREAPRVRREGFEVGE